MFGLEIIEIVMLAIGALIVGFSKAGIQGATIPAVAMLAIIFGGKESASKSRCGEDRGGACSAEEALHRVGNLSRESHRQEG